jgi:thiamine biosynthesis lipoprotein
MYFKSLLSACLLFTINFAFLSAFSPAKTYKLFKITGKAQGTTYSIKYLDLSEVLSHKEIDSVFNLFEQSLSIYNPKSLISYHNKRKKKPVIDAHLLNIIRFSDSLGKASNNTFSIKMLPLLEVWGFKNTKRVQYPDSHYIKQILENNIIKEYIINDLSVFKSTKKLQFDIDGIAQGYCVDYLSNLLLSKGINNFLVEIGGEVFARGTDQLGRKWRVGIQDVDYLSGHKNSEDLVISLDNQGVTTSGKFQKYKKIGDSIISHVLDPRTGYPVKNDLVSVTVLAKNAMLADGLDNVFMVMGIKETMEWLEKNPNIGVYMIYRKKDGSLADTANGYFKNQMFYAESN